MHAYHYTSTRFGAEIIQSQRINVCVGWKLNAVWFSTEPEFEPGMGMFLTWKGEQYKLDRESLAKGQGLVRFGAPLHLLCPLAVACVTMPDAYERFRVLSKEAGADCTKWHVYPNSPFPLALATKWEGYEDGEWKPLDSGLIGRLWDQRNAWVRQGCPMPRLYPSDEPSIAP